MGKFIDLTGNRYGMLVVLERDYSSNTKLIKWKCRCDCGTIKSIYGCSLKSGRSKSCGCQMNKGVKGQNKKHGFTHTRIYKEWLSMRRRCKPNSPDSKIYYDRGITVCPEWNNDFIPFYEWAMANGYDDSLTIDRIDVNGNYCPENCRWITNEMQQSNKTNTIKIMYQGQEYCLRTLCRKIDFPYKLAHGRYMRLKKANKPITNEYLFAPKREKYISNSFRPCTNSK